jgi:hypothetical protein
MISDHIFQLEMKLFDLNLKYERKPIRILEDQIAYYTAMLMDEERYDRELNEAQ